MKFVPQFSNAIYRVLFVPRDPEICHLINLEQMLAQEMHRNNKSE
jgi:aconitase A